MHFVDNPVPLSSRTANDDTTEHSISLLSFSDHNTLLGLENFLVFGKRLLLNLLFSFCLVIRELKEWLHFPSNFNQSLKGLPNVHFHPCLLNDAHAGNDWTRYSLLLPYLKVAIWKLVSSGILTLICSDSRFLCRSKGGTYEMGG
jgi:hypothetical protein